MFILCVIIALIELCFFFRILKTQKEYRCYCPNLNKFVISTDVTLFESKPYFEKDLFLMESVDDCVYFLLRPLSSSSEPPSNQEDLEPLPPTQDKSIHVYKRQIVFRTLSVY